MRSFEIAVPQDTLDELADRLARTRWAGSEPEPLRSLVAHWRGGFDWRAHERALNGFDQVRVEVDGLAVHAVHERGRGPRPLPLVLTHGWPSTFAEFRHVIGPLTDPAAHGGDAADAFDVVVPSLPGFAFSDPVPAGGWAGVPARWVALMHELGYETFGAHAGDVGAFVTNRMAVDHPDRLVGVHVLHPAEPHVPDPDDLTLEERTFLAERAAGREGGTAYAHLHRTRPAALAPGLADSPVALAAWVLDRWWEWIDHDGDLEQAVDRDDLLTTLTLLWATGTAGSSLQAYREWGLGVAPEHAHHYPGTPPGVEPRPLPAGEPITVPAAVALGDVRYPRPFVERAYADLRRWTELPRRGHFPALEQPAALVEDLRAFFRPLRERAPR